MFTSLNSSVNQELFEKHLCDQSSHYEKNKWCCAPQLSSESEVSITLLCQLHMFNSSQSSTNQELFEMHLCNQGIHYEKYGRFSLHKVSMHCMYCGMPKGTSQAKATSSTAKIEPVYLAFISLKASGR